MQLFRGYDEPEDPLKKDRAPLLWLPRIRQTAFGDISDAWRQDLYSDSGLWRRIVDKNLSSLSGGIDRMETAIETIPDRLEGRAFITRYAEPHLPLHLSPDDRTSLSLLISQAYLQSYLAEFDALILADTPIGKLDCDLETLSNDGSLRRLSFREIARCLDLLGIRRLIEDWLTWRELLSLKNAPVFRWFIGLVVANDLPLSKPLDRAVLRARYAGTEPPRLWFRARALPEVLDRLWHFHDLIEPYVVPEEFPDLTPGKLRWRTARRVPVDVPASANQLPLFVGGKAVQQSDVFLIHGRDGLAAQNMKTLLRTMGITPVEWEEAVQWTGKASPYVLEVIQAALARTQAAIILFTPDDAVQLKPDLGSNSDSGEQRQPGFQPRPNVLVETGMALAIYQDRTIIVEFGQLRPISDLQGLHVVRFDGGVRSRDALVTRLRTAGCFPRTIGGDYLNAGFDYLKQNIQSSGA